MNIIMVILRQKTFSNPVAKRKLEKIINQIYELGYVLDERIINRLVNSIWDVIYSL